jgi:hypothetical protein
LGFVQADGLAEFGELFAGVIETYNVDGSEKKVIFPGRVLPNALRTL